MCIVNEKFIIVPDSREKQILQKCPVECQQKFTRIH